MCKVLLKGKSTALGSYEVNESKSVKHSTEVRKKL